MLAANVLKLNLFSALKMMLFPMAIITVFWQDHIGAVERRVGAYLDKRLEENPA